MEEQIAREERELAASEAAAAKAAEATAEQPRTTGAE